MEEELEEKEELRLLELIEKVRLVRSGTKWFEELLEEEGIEPYRIRMLLNSLSLGSGGIGNGTRGYNAGFSREQLRSIAVILSVLGGERLGVMRSLLDLVKRYGWTEPTDCYRFYGENGICLYIGISLSTLIRWGSHENGNWWFEVDRSEISHYPTREEAKKAETRGIHLEHPRYNIKESICDCGFGSDCVVDCKCCRSE